jgi:hypothetical protein
VHVQMGTEVKRARPEVAIDVSGTKTSVTYPAQDMGNTMRVGRWLDLQTAKASPRGALAQEVPCEHPDGTLIWRVGQVKPDESGAATAVAASGAPISRATWALGCGVDWAWAWLATRGELVGSSAAAAGCDNASSVWEFDSCASSETAQPSTNSSGDKNRYVFSSYPFRCTGCR